MGLVFCTSSHDALNLYICFMKISQPVFKFQKQTRNVTDRLREKQYGDLVVERACGKGHCI